MGFLVRGAAAFAAAGLILLPSTGSADAGDFHRVITAFRAEPISPEQMKEREILLDQPVMQQRLVAPRSAVLGNDIILSSGATMERGARLILVVGPKATRFFCGEYVPALAHRLNGYRTKWLCLQDEDQDGRFETMYDGEAQMHVALPAITRITEIGPVSATYAEDAADQRAFYDVALIHQKAVGRPGVVWFYMKVRPQGGAEWRNIASAVWGVSGGYTSASVKTLPETRSLLGFTFEVKAKTGTGVVVRPTQAMEGLVVFGVNGPERP